MKEHRNPDSVDIESIALDNLLSRLCNYHWADDRICEKFIVSKGRLFYVNTILTDIHVYIYIYIYTNVCVCVFMCVYHRHHQVVTLVRISLTLPRHSSQSFIDSGRSSRLHPMSPYICLVLEGGHICFWWFLSCTEDLVPLVFLVISNYRRYPTVTG